MNDKPGIGNSIFKITLDSSTLNTIPNITVTSSSIIYSTISSDSSKINNEPEYKELEDVYKLYLSKFRLKDNRENFISFIEDIFYIINEGRTVKYQINYIGYIDFENSIVDCFNPTRTFTMRDLYYFIKEETLPTLKQRLEEL